MTQDAAEVLVIRDWYPYYERGDAKKIKGALHYVLVPTKHDGKGFRRLVTSPGGTAAFGAWVLLLQVAAKCPRRGVLADDDGPLTAEDIALKTGAAVDDVQRAIEILLSPRIAWLTRCDTADASAVAGYPMKSPEISGDVPTIPEISADLPTSPDASGDFRPNKTIENSREGNKKEKKEKAPAAGLGLPDSLNVSERFRAAWQDWMSYRRERRLTNSNRTIAAQIAICVEHGPNVACEMIRTSIASGWQGLFPPGSKPTASKNSHTRNGAGYKYDPTAGKADEHV